MKPYFQDDAVTLWHGDALSAAERYAAYILRRGHAGNPTPTEVRRAAELQMRDLYDPAAASHRLDLIRALTPKSATTRREVA